MYKIKSPEEKSWLVERKLYPLQPCSQDWEILEKDLVENPENYDFCNPGEEANVLFDITETGQYQIGCFVYLKSENIIVEYDELDIKISKFLSKYKSFYILNPLFLILKILNLP